MRVMCIDAKPIRASVQLLEEGKVYDAEQSDVYPNSYFLGNEFIDPMDDKCVHFGKRRFIPCSEIDETELVNQKLEAV